MKRKLQVFISSTFTDLVAERQAAVSAVLKAGHIPAGMELFTSGDRSQMATIKEWIDDSDVYMLILGGRYGSIEKASLISYTELEYDYAIEQSKPMFAVVIEDHALEAKIKAGGTGFSEKENPKELKLFREKVLSNISSFFEDDKDIKLCVHESLADFAANRELKGWVSGSEFVDPKPLFDELKKLSDENQSLKETLASMEKRATAVVPQLATKTESYSDLADVLEAIEIKVPADLGNGKEVKVNLLSLFYHNKDTFINGVTNSGNASEAEVFFYHNVCPKLQVHGLIANEKVPGARYRRSCVTSLGNKFLANMDRTVLLKKEEAGAKKTPSVDSSKTSAVSPKSIKSKGGDQI